MTIYAVVGASRGIGLQFVRQLAARPGTTVFALVRNASTSIHLNAAVGGLKNVHVLEADVADHSSLERAAQQVSALTGGKLDCLIHNAAHLSGETIMKGFDSYTNIDELDADFITAYKVNALGVVHSVIAFLPLLRNSTEEYKKIVVIGAGGADHKFVYHAELGDVAAYGMSKAAALIATTKWALKLKDEGFIVVNISPGLVDTSDTLTATGLDPATKASIQAAADDISAKTKGPFHLDYQTAAESVADQLKVVDGLKPSDNGLMLSHKGGEWGV